MRSPGGRAVGVVEAQRRVVPIVPPLAAVAVDVPPLQREQWEARMGIEDLIWKGISGGVQPYPVRLRMLFPELDEAATEVARGTVMTRRVIAARVLPLSEEIPISLGEWNGQVGMWAKVLPLLTAVAAERGIPDGVLVWTGSMSAFAALRPQFVLAAHVAKWEERARELFGQAPDTRVCGDALNQAIHDGVVRDYHRRAFERAMRIFRAY